MMMPLDPGVWGVLCTPFYGRESSVDVDSYVNQIELYRGIGATGIVALGVFGEAITLDSDEQHLIVKTTADAAGGLPAIIGLTSLSTRPAITQARIATEALGDKLSGVMVQVNSSDRRVVIEHLHSIHRETGAGIVLQDYPRISSVHISMQGLTEVIEACPFVAAIKAEAPPTSRAVALLTAHTGIPVFGGLGGVGLIDELAAGAAGAMTGFSHPEGLVATVDAYRNGGFGAARRAFQSWLPLANFEGQTGIGLAIRKEVLRARGIISSAQVRPPGHAFPESLRKLLEQHVQEVPRV